MKITKKRISDAIRTKRHEGSFPNYFTFNGDVDFNDCNFQFEKSANGSSYITVREQNEDENYQYDGSCPECVELPTFEATKKDLINDIYDFINK